MKKKFSLTNDLVKLEDEPSLETPEVFPPKREGEGEELVTITIRVPKKFRSEIKSWCSKNDMSIVNAIKSGLLLLKNSPNMQ
jgi:hypothetical protein